MKYQLVIRMNQDFIWASNRRTMKSNGRLLGKVPLAVSFAMPQKEAVLCSIMGRFVFGW